MTPFDRAAVELERLGHRGALVGGRELGTRFKVFGSPGVLRSRWRRRRLCIVSIQVTIAGRCSSRVSPWRVSRTSSPCGCRVADTVPAGHRVPDPSRRTGYSARQNKQTEDS